jgi:uncharacterized protein (DUF433 family)
VTDGYKKRDSFRRSEGCDDVVMEGEGVTSDRITADAKVMLGKPVIRGTRIPVELVLRKLSEGATIEDLLDGYPHLKREDILACLAYGAAAVAHEEIVFLSPTESRR